MRGIWPRRLGLALLAAASIAFAAHADDDETTRASAPAASAVSPDSTPADDPPATTHRHSHHRHGGDDGNIVSVGHDSRLTDGQSAESVVSILGSSTSAGNAEDVVSVVGDTTVTGAVHDAAVAVVGNVYVDGHVEGDVVAVIGSVTLGPHAIVDGDVVTVLGAVTRDPAAVVHGSVQDILATHFGDFKWLRTWIAECLLYGRPLAPVSGLGWAWSLALAFLAIYLCLALVFREATSGCVKTLEKHPGQSLLAAVIAALLAPVLIVLLCVTVVGIAAVPFVALSLLCMGLFGKAVSLAWLGGRITGGVTEGPFAQPVVAVAVGGVLALALYLVPVVGFLVYNLLGVMGFGAVVFSVILAVRSRQESRAQPAAANATPPEADAAAAHPEHSTPPLSTQTLATLPRAGFWIRMAALSIDMLVVGFAMSLLHDGFHSHLIVLAAYGAIMWKLRGSTVGGIVLDLKVVQSDGRPLDWQVAIVRALSCFLSLAVAGLGFIWIAFDPGSRSWHDKIAGTIVVRVPKATRSG